MKIYREKILEILKFLTNRLFILALVLLVGFGVLVAELFERQIVHGTYRIPVLNTHERAIPINAPRGNVFDVNGRPLAVSIPVFAVVMDPSTIFDVAADGNFDLNEAFLLFMEIMERNNETLSIESEFFISDTIPRGFFASEATRRRWLRDLNIDEDLTAARAYDELLANFDIPTHLSRDARHTLLQLRTALYLQRFNSAQVSLGVGLERNTVAALEEFSHALPGIRVAFDYLRYYPEGRYLTNIVGFINRINERDLAANMHLGYTGADFFGSSGVERAFEHELRGTRGQEIIEVDNNFRRVGVVEIIAPVPGQDIFLTIDSVLQRNIYYILEDTLATVHLNHLRNHPTIYTREILSSTIRANNISSLLIMDADGEEFPASYALQSFVWQHSGLTPEDANDLTAFRRNVNEFIGDNILNGRINVVLIFEIMAEQGLFEFAPYELARLRAGQIAPAAFLQGLIESRKLTPQMMNIDPATASAVIICVHTGAIIAAVNYPTFDANNFLPHRRDGAYIHALNIDPTAPQFSRVFMETNAPGSTFKMITALAGLSQGVITPSTRIFDGGVFRDAGRPYVQCHSRHGSINVVQAIAVSCNYFFNRVAFNLGNRHNGRTQEGIAVLNYYMRALGLGSPTGVEVYEARQTLASPELRTHEGGGAWTDGNTSHVSIGQGYNDYTVLSMAKVMATLATGGTRMQMHLLNRMEAADGTITPFVPVVEYQLDIDPVHLEAVHRGMLEVTAPGGTGAGIFRNFPMQVGIKSGTAEVAGNRNSHSSYGGFAPFDNPQIAAYVVIPHGDVRYLRASAGHAMRDILTEFFGLETGEATAPEAIIN
ncbi:MAG: hypothetical protein LBE35_04345 [Clostridiales bacterium]|jgi:penicillin-binding protein 2|nr:hypothetical protein [Clostridiales bacterium]